MIESDRIDAGVTTMQILRPGYFSENVSFQDEVPLDHIPDLEWWSENFCFTGYDHKNHVGYWFHVGRWIRDPSMWREVVFFYMPDGSVLVNRSFGKGDISKGPGGTNLKMTCIEAGKRWKLQYHGPAQPVTLSELMRAPIKDPAEIYLVDVDLDLTGVSPLWYFGEKENTTWGKWHNEQHCEVTGRLSVGERNWDYEGAGYRDHSRGPRMLAPVRGHCWIQARFPNGDQIASFQMWHDVNGVDSEELFEATVVIDGKRTGAVVERSPRLAHPGEMLNPQEMVIRYDDKRLALTCTPVSTICFSLSAGFNHIMFGMTTGVHDWPITVFNQPTIFTTDDGRRAEGWLERCIYRHEDGFDPDHVAVVYAARR